MRPHILYNSSQHTLDWSCPVSTHYNISHFSVPNNILSKLAWLEVSFYTILYGHINQEERVIKIWPLDGESSAARQPHLKDQKNAQLQEALQAWTAEPERLKNITTLAHFRRQTQLLMSLRQDTLISEFKRGCLQPNTNSEPSKTVSSSMHCKT